MKKQYIITLLIILFSIISHAQVVGFGDGSDGLVTISTSNVVVNEYRKITNVSGNIVSEYNVTSSTPFNTNFSIGKCVLLINMVTGDYHFDKVYHYTTNILTLWNVQNVDLSVFGDSSQILNVPMYQNLTVNSGGQLTCQPWNSATGTGGVLSFLVKGLLSLNNGTIDVSGKGYNGISGGSSAVGGNGGLGGNQAPLNIPVHGLNGQWGGEGAAGSGNGGIYGALGNPAAVIPGSGIAAQNATSPPNFFMGKGGIGGNGGAGGRGAGGGGSDYCQPGIDGEAGGSGGNGGEGGDGSGIIIFKAANIDHFNTQFLLNGNIGTDAVNATVGGNGGDGTCLGGGGGGANGGNGGNGGGGGAGGAMKVIKSIGSNGLNPSLIDLSGGLGGLGGQGGAGGLGGANSNVSCVCDSIWSSGGVIVGTGGSPSPCVLSCDFNNILELLLDLDFGISSDEDLIPMISYTSGDTTYEVRIIPFNNDSTNANILVDFLIEDSIMCTYSVPIGVDGLNVYDCLFNLMADGYVSMEMDSFYISQQGCTITNLCNSIRAEAQNGEDGEDGVDGPAGEEGIYEEEDEGCIFEEEPMCIFMYPCESMSDYTVVGGMFEGYIDITPYDWASDDMSCYQELYANFETCEYINVSGETTIIDATSITYELNLGDFTSEETNLLETNCSFSATEIQVNICESDSFCFDIPMGYTQSTSGGDNCTNPQIYFGEVSNPSDYYYPELESVNSGDAICLNEEGSFVLEYRLIFNYYCNYGPWNSNLEEEYTSHFFIFNVTHKPTIEDTIYNYSCNPLDTGIVVNPTVETDTVCFNVTVITMLLPSRSITFNATTCNPANVGTVVQNLTNQFECDSIVTTITTLLPSSSEIINATTCNPANVGTVVQNLTNQFNCDSIVTTITTLLPSSSEIINATTCNPANVGTVVQNLTNQFGCDSVVTTITTLLPSSSEIINTTTCNPANVGTVVQNLTNQFDCDSIVTTITTLLPSNSEIINATTCNPANVGTVVQNLANQYGCDSIVTTITTLLPSSSEIINTTTCNPANVGTVVQNLTNQYGCDSIVTTITTLLPSSSEIINTTTCNSANVGTVVQNLTSQFGCDSIVMTITTLLPSSSEIINATTCNPANVGTVVQNLTNQFDCDSIVTTITTLLPSSSEIINATTCNPANVGTVVQNLTNQFDCDSIVTTITTLLPSSSEIIYATTCNPANVGTVVQNLTNQFDCDSVVTTITTLLPSYTDSIYYYSCNPADTGIVIDTLLTIDKCDSVITNIYISTPLDIQLVGSLEYCNGDTLEWCFEGCEDCVYEVYFHCTNTTIAFTENCLTVPLPKTGCDAKECFFTVYAKDTITGCFTKFTDTLTIYPKPEIHAYVKQDACSEVGDIIVELKEKCCEKVLYSIDGVNYQTSNIFPNMPAGLYTVYVMYDEGCELGNCIAITEVEILSETSLDIELVGSLEFCSGDSLNWCIEGCDDCVYEVYFHCNNTTIAFTDNCLTVPLPKTGCDPKECIFTVYAKDTITGCFTKFTDTLTIYPKPEIEAIVEQKPCSDIGDIVVEIKEMCCDVELYSIDGVNYQTSNIFPNMPAGTYTVYVIYAESCGLGDCIATTEVEILSNTPLDIQLVGSLEYCSGDTLEWCFEGCEDCVYEIYFECNNSSISLTDNCLIQPLPNIGCNLIECVFIVYAKDTITGCFTKFTDTLTIYPKPEITAIVKQDACSEVGDIVVEIKEMCCDVELYSIDGVNFQTSNIFPNMPVGVYTVYVIYAESCGLGDCIATTEVEILSNTPLDIEFLGSLELCSESNLDWCIEGCEDCVYEVYFQCTNAAIAFTDNCLTVPILEIGCEAKECEFTIYATDTITGCKTKLSDILTIYPKPEITAIVKQDACSEVGDIIVELNDKCCNKELYSIDGVNYQTSNIFPNMPAGVYTVYVKYDEGCKLFDCIAITQVEILSATSFEVDFCYEINSNNNFISFYIENAPVCEDAIYTWSFGNGQTYVGQNPPDILLGFVTYEVCLTIECNGCVVKCCKKVIVSKPCKNLNSNFNYIIPNNSYTATFLSNQTGVNYSWQITDLTNNITLPSPSSNALVSYTFPSSGNYRVCLTVTSPNNQCSFTTCNDIIINPLCKLKPIFEINLCDNVLQLENVSPTLNSSSTTAWTVTTANAIHNLSGNLSNVTIGNGSFKVCMTYTNGNCKTTICRSFTNSELSCNSNLKIDNFEEELESEIQFELHPNPFKSVIQINYSLPNELNGKLVQIKLYSETGVLIENLYSGYESNMKTTKNLNTAILPGIYLISLEVENFSVVKKMVKGY